MNVQQEALDRIIALCHPSVRALLLSRECRSALLHTTEGLQWQITVTQTGFVRLFEHDSLITMVGAAMVVAPVLAIVLQPPLDVAVCVPTARLAHYWQAQTAIDAAASNDVRAQHALRDRLYCRCLLALKLIPDVAIIMDGEGRYLAIDGKAAHLVEERAAIQGQFLEAVLPAALCGRWRYRLKMALQHQGHRFTLLYTLPIKGLPRRYRAIFKGYGGSDGEVLILVKEVSAWLRR